MMTRRLVNTLVLWYGVVWGVPGALLAQTALLRTAPTAGALLAQPPREVRLWFTEPIERQFSRIEVFQALLDPATGQPKPTQRIDQGWLPGPRTTREVAVRLPETLAPGRYLVPWRMLAVDAHRSQGSLLFTYDPTSAT